MYLLTKSLYECLKRNAPTESFHAMYFTEEKKGAFLLVSSAAKIIKSKKL